MEIHHGHLQNISPVLISKYLIVVFWVVLYPIGGPHWHIFQTFFKKYKMLILTYKIIA